MHGLELDRGELAEATLATPGGGRCVRSSHVARRSSFLVCQRCRSSTFFWSSAKNAPWRRCPRRPDPTHCHIASGGEGRRSSPGKGQTFWNATWQLAGDDEVPPLSLGQRAVASSLPGNEPLAAAPCRPDFLETHSCGPTGPSPGTAQGASRSADRRGLRVVVDRAGQLNYGRSCGTRVRHRPPDGSCEFSRGAFEQPRASGNDIGERPRATAFHRAVMA
jgi:hypothetical protein